MDASAINKTDAENLIIAGGGLPCTYSLANIYERTKMDADDIEDYIK